MKYRNVREADYEYVIGKLNSWWGGRNMTDMLPRLFFTYFQTSSFLCTIDGRVVGFIVGFISDSVRDTGYVHFVGVDPECRKLGVGKELYSMFTEYCATNGVVRVKCVTSPKNTDSISFHHRLGFRASSYDEDGNPMPMLNYDGPGEDRVLFSMQLGA